MHFGACSRPGFVSHCASSSRIFQAPFCALLVPNSTGFSAFPMRHRPALAAIVKPARQDHAHRCRCGPRSTLHRATDGRKRRDIGPRSVARLHPRICGACLGDHGKAVREGEMCMFSYEGSCGRRQTASGRRPSRRRDPEGPAGPPLSPTFALAPSNLSFCLLAFASFVLSSSLLRPKHPRGFSPASSLHTRHPVQLAWPCGEKGTLALFFNFLAFPHVARLPAFNACLVFSPFSR